MNTLLVSRVCMWLMLKQCGNICHEVERIEIIVMFRFERSAAQYNVLRYAQAQYKKRGSDCMLCPTLRLLTNVNAVKYFRPIGEANNLTVTYHELLV